MLYCLLLLLPLTYENGRVKSAEVEINHDKIQETHKELSMTVSKDANGNIVKRQPIIKLCKL